MNQHDERDQKREVDKATSMNKELCRRLVTEVDDVVRPIAQELGLHVEVKRCKYDLERASITVEWCTIAEDGEPNSQEAEDFRRYAAARYDLDPSILGQPINLPGLDGAFRVIGLRRRARRCPILVRSEATREVFAVNEVVIKLAVQGNRTSTQEGARR